MSKLYSFALHDLRVSEGQKALDTIAALRKHFQIPLTIHLVFDAKLETQPELLEYLCDHVHAGNLEIVFHGLKHTCSRHVSKLWAFYHKYQAEYLENNERHREATKVGFREITTWMKMKLGICPPCWLSSRENNVFLTSLEPLYIEKMLYLQHLDKKIASPVISIGSPRGMEVFFLQLLAGAIAGIAGILGMNRVRIVMHACDLDREASLSFFEKTVSTFTDRGFKPVLLRKLSEC
jgi:hypothetical protein